MWRWNGSTRGLSVHAMTGPPAGGVGSGGLRLRSPGRVGLRWRFAAVVALTAAVSSCGGGGSKAHRPRKAGDSGATIAALESSDRHQVASAFDAEMLAALGGLDRVVPAGDRLQVDRASWQADGGLANATITVKDAAGASRRFIAHFVLERGNWRLLVTDAAQ